MASQTSGQGPIQQWSEPHGSGGSQSVGETVISCNWCRSRKLRCSRELPSCQQCRKTGSRCEYKREKMKPGIKAGAIESLHRRLDRMEETIEEMKTTDPEGVSTMPAAQESTVQSVMAILAREIHRLGEGKPSIASTEEANQGQSGQRKRRRVESGNDEELNLGAMPPLPPAAVLDQVLDSYFSRLHPWIPMLQENRFKQRLDDSEECPKLFVILQAMIVSAIRYVDSPDMCGMTPESLEARRNWVVANAMSSLVIESLQALTIIVFNDIGRGRAMRAWPIVGSLTRTIEYLQLTVERDDLSRPQPLSRPYMTNALRDDNISWIELEERRRVFWVVFNLDRFCSITMGWNTSLTSDDACRRLPCDITLWWQDEPVLTPYFNIWDKSAGRIGNPIAFLPSRYKSKGGGDDHEGGKQDHASSTGGSAPPRPRRQSLEIGGVTESPTFGDQQQGSPPDSSTIGAFAYSVEATESLNQVTTYFLQQRVDMRNEREVEAWLTRFKELDLRLIHWKMLLPQKWKPDMGGNRLTGRMDPNLTLAHVTHNASIVLLHQAIAFPRLEWAFKNRLPSLSSAETCHAAAVMVAAIANNYLDVLPYIPVTHLFAFCIFVCARALIIHWRYYSTTHLTPEFESLVHSLDRIAHQWRGVTDGQAATSSTLAGLYAMKLRRLKQRCTEDEYFRIDPSNYTMDGGDADETWSATPGVHVPQPLGPPSGTSQHRDGHAISPGSGTTMLQSSSLAYHRDQRSPAQTEPTPAPQTSYEPPMMEPTDGMDSISQLFLDPQFVNVDRIISLEDNMFDIGYAGNDWS